MRPAPRTSQVNQPNVGRSDAAEGRALSIDSPPPTGAVHPHGSAVPLPHGGGGSFHPDAGRVLDADAAHPSPIRLTDDEAEDVAIEADVLDAKHGGPFAWWVAYILHDIQHGARDRHGRRQFLPHNP